MIQPPSRQRFQQRKKRPDEDQARSDVTIAVFAIVVISAWNGATRGYGPTAEDMNVVDRTVTPGV
jgi:hypothetical protein